MRILLKTVLDASPDAVWRALRSPTVLGELYGPLLQPSSLDGTFPDVWTNGSARVGLSLAGLVPLGSQEIVVRLHENRPDSVRIMQDAGGPLTGPLALLSGWDHQMAVAPAPGRPGATLYRDRLTISGPAAAAYWYPLWTMWQWRGARMRAMAPGWEHNTGIDVPVDDTAAN